MGNGRGHEATEGFLRQVEGRLDIGVRQQDGKLLAAVTSDDVCCSPSALLQHARNLYQTSVSRLMSVAVVETLEVVGNTMNIIAMTKFSSMSPNALFRPINGSKLACGLSAPNPRP